MLEFCIIFTSQNYPILCIYIYADDTSSVVDAHMEDGILSAKMYCPEDVYVIEVS